MADEANANVIFDRFALIFKDREMVIDLTQPQDTETVFSIMEGAFYRIQLDFRVRDKIVSGLRYHHVIKYKGIKADKRTLLIGSYGPLKEQQTFTSTEEFEVPKGMVYRGDYEVYSKCVDDDSITLKEFTWAMSVKKSWD